MVRRSTPFSFANILASGEALIRPSACTKVEEMAGALIAAAGVDGVGVGTGVGAGAGVAAAAGVDAAG